MYERRGFRLALATTLLVTPALAGFEQTKLLAPDGASLDHFGFAVALHGDTAVIGAPTDSDVNGKTGSVYVLRRTAGNWSLEAKLLADDGAAQDRFGFSLAFDGATLVVGADSDDDHGSQSGSAYIFTRTGATWTQQAKLTASDGEAKARFGRSVAVRDGTVVVGSYNDSDQTIGGAAYVYTAVAGAWTEQVNLPGLDQEPRDGFGYAVAVAGGGETVVVGSPFDNDNGVNSGTVYLFSRDGGNWTQSKLYPGDAQERVGFGLGLAVDGDTMLVGAANDDETALNAGSTYVFVGADATWTQQAKLLASDGSFNEGFGISVALSGNYAVIGADWDDDNGDLSGSAYVFSRIGGAWQERFKLLPPDGLPGGLFGSSVALSGDTALVGTWGDDDNGAESGAAWVYDLPPLPGDDPVPAVGSTGALILLVSMLVTSASLLLRRRRDRPGARNAVT